MQPDIKIHVNHLGFLCHARKTAVFQQTDQTTFQVQNMGIVAQETLGEYENWQTVYEGPLKKHVSAMGEYLVGDFSALEKPGIYRIVLPDGSARSYQFMISDGVFHQLIRLFLDNIHQKRSGFFENEWRGPMHLDDAVHDSTKDQKDTSGGWYDAGDLRKWMTTANLPALGFLAIAEKLNLSWNYFAEEEVSNNDLLTESAWAIQYILKMQDPETGMFYEEIGGGGAGRALPGMSWWYDNHSGCLADNSENRFTDNLPDSGDERYIRTSYNPIVQYVSITILLKTAQAFAKIDGDFSKKCSQAAMNSYQFISQQAATDDLHNWTSVRSWRLMAAIELYKINQLPQNELEDFVKDLLLLFNRQSGFWWMDQKKDDCYRGILHSAQPIIALLEFLKLIPQSKHSEDITKTLNHCWLEYILPMSKTNPFGMIPYGQYLDNASEKDLYRAFKSPYKFRFFMPDNSKQRVNHGLGGHWTGWAHALILMGKQFNNQDMIDLAWNQFYWLVGFNSLNVSSISGIGYNNPMPHSRFMGTMVGGFQVGARGNLQDEMVIDQEARAEWSTTEYWNVPTANTLLMFSEALPSDINVKNKIGGS